MPVAIVSVTVSAGSTIASSTGVIVIVAVVTPTPRVTVTRVARARPAGHRVVRAAVAVPPSVRFTVMLVNALPERVTVKTIGSLAASAPEASVAATETVGVPSLSAIEPVALDGVPTV